MKTNILFDTNDSINFGQMDNEPFKWIYLLSTNYLVWLIQETDICFSSLELFNNLGDRYILDKGTLTKNQEDEFFILIEKYGKNHFTGNSKAYLLTVDIFAKSIEQKILLPINFKLEKFTFDQKTVNLNEKKLQSCKATYNFPNLERDLYLKNLFKR